MEKTEFCPSVSVGSFPVWVGDRFHSPSYVLGPPALLSILGLRRNWDGAVNEPNLTQMEMRDSKTKENDLERKPKEITISRRLLNLH